MGGGGWWFYCCPQLCSSFAVWCHSWGTSVCPGRQHTSKALQRASQYLDAVMRANMRAGQRGRWGARGFTSPPAQPFVFISLRFGLFFCCCRSHLWNGIETVFCFGFPCLSLPPPLSHSVSLSLPLLLLQFLLLLLFPVSVSAVAFPFTSFVPKQLTLWLWLNALIYQIGRRPRCYTPSPLSSPYSLLPFPPLTPFAQSFSLQARTLRALPIGDCAAQGFPLYLPSPHPTYL